MLKWAPSNKYLQLLWHLYWTSQSHFSKNRRLLWAIVCSGSLKLLEVKTFNVRKRKTFSRRQPTHDWVFEKDTGMEKKPLMPNEVLRFWLYRYWRSGWATPHLREIMGLTDFWGWICSCRSTFLSDICTKKITRKISSVKNPGTTGWQASRLPLCYSFPQVSSNIVSDFNSFLLEWSQKLRPNAGNFTKGSVSENCRSFFQTAEIQKLAKERKKESSLRNSSLVSVWVKGGGREVYIYRERWREREREGKRKSTFKATVCLRCLFIAQGQLWSSRKGERMEEEKEGREREREREREYTRERESVCVCVWERERGKGSGLHKIRNSLRSFLFAFFPGP